MTVGSVFQVTRVTPDSVSKWQAGEEEGGKDYPLKVGPSEH